MSFFFYSSRTEFQDLVRASYNCVLLLYVRTKLHHSLKKKFQKGTSIFYVSTSPKVKIKSLTIAHRKSKKTGNQFSFSNPASIHGILIETLELKKGNPQRNILGVERLAIIQSHIYIPLATYLC